MQHLRTVIYPLPSAKVMGYWNPDQIRATAHRYGKRMKLLGLGMDFGPDADLAVPGSFIDIERRAFSDSPRAVATAVKAWTDGMKSAGIVPVIKHWPGHGAATNTHQRAAVIAPLPILEQRDIVPFESAFKRDLQAVMVGHLSVPGLTRGKEPASMSRSALTYLRARTGPKTVIITDSLSMGASSSALRINPAMAAVRALEAGADWALVCSYSPAKVASAIKHALNTGSLPRPQAIESARRILALKHP